MARKEANLKSCMIVQELNNDYYENWTESELSVLKDVEAGKKKVSAIIEVFLKRYEKAYFKLKKSKKVNVVENIHSCYGILHDKDVKKEWNDDLNCYVDVPVELHYHIIIRFNDAVFTLNELAQILGIEAQYIEKQGRGRYGYDNMLSYLTHIKYEDKYQYSYKDVYSLKTCKNYSEIYAEQHENWLRGRAEMNKKKANLDIDLLLEKILTGEIVRSEILDNQDYFKVYSRNFRKCNEALEIYTEQKIHKTLKSIKNNEFKVAVFFVTGVSGSGKTRFVNNHVNDLISSVEKKTGEKWEVYNTAATNAMDDYSGEEIMVMDDVRGSAMSASDWLKLLDPYNISPASARYKNRTACSRVIYITSTKEPIEFFYYCKKIGGGNRSEEMEQFLRRIQSLTQVLNVDDKTKYILSKPVKTEKYIVEVSSDDVQKKMVLLLIFLIIMMSN